MGGFAYKNAFIHIIGRDKDGRMQPLRYVVEWLDTTRKEYKTEKSAKRAIDYRLKK